MAFNVVGLIAIIVFYVLILLVGIWAARKGGKPPEGGESEDIMLAGRNIGVWVGIFTMTATWVGGGYINGTAESVYTSGLTWCQAPFGYALSLIVGGILFAEKMRTQGYVTMLDPFQNRYGERMVGLLFLPALLGEVFWSAAILSALGATLTVILDLNPVWSIVISSCIAVFYTFFGGLYSVAYTDVVQLFCIFIGLWICIPASILSPASKPIDSTFSEWVGTSSLSSAKQILLWIDFFLLLVFGGIPWQVYFQRVLSSKSAYRAKVLSYVAAVGCVIMAIPSVIIGAVAKSTDWNQTNWEHQINGTIPVLADYTRMTLPLVLQYLTPTWVAFIGLGAVSAAVMSSADSSILSAASMFARNIWKMSIRRNASEREVIIVMRVAVILVGVMATVMAIKIDSIYALWFLCSDLVYVILFPQLLCVVYMTKANTYGSLAGYILGISFRFLGGEKEFGIPAAIHWPLYEEGVQHFPFRTLAMLISLSAIIGVSLLTYKLFTEGRLPQNYDVFQCIVNIPHDRFRLQECSVFAASTDTLAMNHIKLPQENGGGAVNPLLLSASRSGASSAVTSPDALLPPERLPLRSTHAVENGPPPSYESVLVKE